jgi:phosphocarrier protein HPr
VIRRDVTIVNRLGLHARAAAKLVAMASRFGASVRIERDGRGADAKSIMAVMMLAATRGTQVTLAADGADEAAAIDALAALIAERFGEDE